jgi:hypothetical protein
MFEAFSSLSGPRCSMIDCQQQPDAQLFSTPSVSLLPLGWALSLTSGPNEGQDAPLADALLRPY